MLTADDVLIINEELHGRLEALIQIKIHYEHTGLSQEEIPELEARIANIRSVLTKLYLQNTNKPLVPCPMENCSKRTELCLVRAS